MLALLVPEESQGVQEIKAAKVLEVQVELQVLLGKLDLLVAGVHLAKVDHQVLPGHQVKLEQQGGQEDQDRQENVDLQVQEERVVALVDQDYEGHLVHLDHLGDQVRSEEGVHREKQEKLAPLEVQDQVDQMDHQDHLVLAVQQVQQDSLE